MTGRKPDERIRTPMRWDASEPAAGFSAATPWQPLGDDPPGPTSRPRPRTRPRSSSAYRDLVGLRDRASGAARSATSAPGRRATRRRSSRYLRHVPGQTMLVVANLADEAVDAPVLSLESGPLCGTPSAHVVLRVGGEASRSRRRRRPAGSTRTSRSPRSGRARAIVIELGA